ncbi:MAG: pirin family protein [Ignavibacteriales bacterium]|nr:Quercetin 2,3-dioxygenase [Ignavibacteriaceae bacterium]MBZ0197222.1 pirin family protein [Ignavibacteriaceae bacterium]MCZ2143540.1 pirin family protein [Ignavibacteriales bacterium]WKZ72136.1 MAG: pirin family protein [Ignavibacteriaceae bacterium]
MTSKLMNTILHTADSRGGADHGWLKTKHTFSFANYYDPARMHFGALRVLNDDYIEPGMGFGMHPHDNMEIITIPLVGDLEHKDSMGNTEVIRHGDIQVMSAGSGIRHSEYNKNNDQPVELLQIWVYPNRRDVTPRYDQITLNIADRKNKFQQIVSPNKNDDGVWIHQDAWFNIADLEKGKELDYTLNNPQNGLYVFVISGEAEVQGQKLNPRDGFGLWDTNKVNFKSITGISILLMEVPMNQ